MTPALATALSGAARAALTDSGIDAEDAVRVITQALAEDLRYGPDRTTAATVPADAVAPARITPRAPGVLAGAPLVHAVLDLAGAGGCDVLSRLPDGSRLVPGEPAVVLEGPVGGLLGAERVALNLVCHLSGVATATDRWVRAVAGTGARIRDSRKTLPGLRLLEKYAVRRGGGVNHRMGLGDALLVKDNHVAAAGSVTAAVRAARSAFPGLRCEVEVDDLAQFEEAVAAGAEEILLDNFTPGQCAEAVALVAGRADRPRLEASGGLTLDRARAYAETGVDYLAVGALTHSAPALDLGMDLAAIEPTHRGQVA